MATVPDGLRRLYDEVREWIREGKAELIDDWLRRQRGKGVTCHTHHIEVYFPVEHERAQEAYEMLMRTISDVFRGATVWEATGYFCQDPPCTPERTLKEKTKIISVWHHCTSEDAREAFARALKQAEEMTGQTSIGIKGTNRFYVIPTQELKLPAEGRR